MSAHCSTREPSGCAAAIAVALLPVCFAAYGAWSLARWLLE